MGWGAHEHFGVVNLRSQFLLRDTTTDNLKQDMDGAGDENVNCNIRASVAGALLMWFSMVR